MYDRGPMAELFDGRWRVIVPRRNWFVMAALALGVAALAAGAVRAGAQSRAPAAELQQLKAKVAQATRMLAREGIIAASGHVSARMPGTDRVVIGPADVTRDILTADDIITVDLEFEEDRRQDARAARDRNPHRHLSCAA